MQALRSVALPVLITFSSLPALAGPLVASAPGEDLRVVVHRQGRDGASGTIRFEGVEYPFSGRVQGSGGAFRLEGTLIDEGERMPFSAQWQDGRFVLVADGQQAQLAIEDAGDFGGAPSTRAPRREDEPRRTKRTAPPKRGGRAAALPKELRLRQVEFRDIHMNNMVAYRQLVPKGWKSTGHVEWSGGGAPHPQRKIEITAPNGVEIQYLPAMKFEYIELSPQFIAQAQQFGQPLPPMPQPNIPPPQDIGGWLADTMMKVSREITNARVVSSQRDHQGEQTMLQLLGPNSGCTRHLIQLAYDKNGRAYLADIALTLQVLPLSAFSAGRAVTWAIYVDHVAAYPTDAYESYRPIALTVIGSQRSTPEWFAAKTRTLSQLSQQRHANAMATIKRNGEMRARANDQQMAAWRKQQAASDQMHKKFVNSIHDTDDYALPGGGTVNLPSTYNHVYQTRSGDYLLSESSLDGADLTRLSPQR